MARFACSNYLNGACALQFSSSVTESQLEWDQDFDWTFQFFFFFLFLSLSNVNFTFCLSCWNTLSQIYFGRVKHAFLIVFFQHFAPSIVLFISTWFQVLSLSACTLRWRYSASEGVGSVRLAPHASLTISAEKLYFGVI